MKSSVKMKLLKLNLTTFVGMLTFVNDTSSQNINTNGLTSKEIEANEDEYFFFLGIFGFMILILCVVTIILCCICLLWQRCCGEDVISSTMLQRFKDGDPKELKNGSNNPEVLPYDKNFEFSRKNLVFQKLLNKGNFGDIRKAIAKGIVTHEESSTVAVRKISARQSADKLQKIMLELKTMIHMENHLK